MDETTQEIFFPSQGEILCLRRVRDQNRTSALSCCVVRSRTGGFGADRIVLASWLCYRLFLDPATGEIHSSLRREKDSWEMYLFRWSTPGIYEMQLASGLGPKCGPKDVPTCVFPRRKAGDRLSVDYLLNKYSVRQILEEKAFRVCRGRPEHVYR